MKSYLKDITQYKSGDSNKQGGDIDANRNNVDQLFSNVWFQVILMALMLTGFLQAIIGNLQLYGILPSYHNMFKITGMFFNPGPYAGYLAMIFTLALGVYLFFKNMHSNIPAQENTCVKIYTSNILLRKIIPVILKYTALVTILAILLILPAARSRAAWLALAGGSLVVLNTRYKLRQKTINVFNTFAKRLVVAIVFIAFLILIGLGLFHFKKESALARIFIWEVSLDMIQDKPLFGHGYDMFVRDYNNYQAQYFAENGSLNRILTSEEPLVDNSRVKGQYTDKLLDKERIAGFVDYGFNEFIQLTSETGVVGLLIFVALLIFLFMKKHTIKANTYSLPYTLYISILVAFVVFSLFSYPLSVLPLQMLLFVSIATLSFQRPLQFAIPFVPGIRRYVQLFFLAAIIILCVILFPVFHNKYIAYIEWRKANMYLISRIYQDAVDIFEKKFDTFDYKPRYVHQYGKSLVLSGKYTEGIEILEQAKKLGADPYLYNTLGDAYKSIKEYNKSEEAYLHALKMIPNKFYPRYLLAKLYLERKDNEKAYRMAQSIIEKEIKVKSRAIIQMKKEMKTIIKKLE